MRGFNCSTYSSALSTHRCVGCSLKRKQSSTSTSRSCNASIVSRRNLAEISQVSKIVEAISHHRQTAVDHFQRRDHAVRFRCRNSRPAITDVRNHFRQTAAEVRRLEDVFEDAFDIDPRAFVRINAECAETKVQRADVVETKNVIGVTVRDQDRVEMSSDRSATPVGESRKTYRPAQFARRVR